MFPPEFSKYAEYWRRPTKPARGEDDAAAIYCAVGQALTAWEIVETAMARLFATLTGRGSLAAARAYGTISNAVGRREALEAAAEAFFAERGAPQQEVTSTPARQLFINLTKNYGEAAARRNDIAHGAAGSFRSYELGYLLIPADYNTRKTKLDYVLFENDENDVLGQYAYAFNKDDINNYAEKFTKLFIWIFTFYQLLDTAYSCGRPHLDLFGPVSDRTEANE